MKASLAAWMAATGLAWAASAGAARLTSDQVRFPQVMITQQDGREVLTLRGVIHGDSFHVISKARQHPQRDGEINLEAHAGAMWFRREGRSGSFVFHIPLNDSLRRITYGPDRTPVWERDLPAPPKQRGSWRAGPQSMEEVRYRLDHYESGLTREVRSPATSAMAQLAPPDHPWTWLRSALTSWGRIDPDAAVHYLTARTPAHEHEYFIPWIYLSYTQEQLQRWYENEAQPQLRDALASALSQRRQLSPSPPPAALPPRDPAPR